MLKMHRAFAARAALDPSAADSVSRARLEQSESSSHTHFHILADEQKTGHLIGTSSPGSTWIKGH